MVFDRVWYANNEQKVVYLMIVNMPSEEELQQARAAMQ